MVSKKKDNVGEAKAQVLSVVKAYQTAAYAKDVDAFVSLYHPDVRVFDMWGEWSYDGLASWRAMVSEWFGSLGSERVEVDVSEVRLSIGNDLAVVHAFITYRGLSAEGKELRSMCNRVTWSLKAEGGWKIVHEHTSAPADFKTFKVNVER